MKPVNLQASEQEQVWQYRVWTAVQVPELLQERARVPVQVQAQVPVPVRVLQVPVEVPVPWREQELLRALKQV